MDGEEPAGGADERGEGEEPGPRASFGPREGSGLPERSGPPENGGPSESGPREGFGPSEKDPPDSGPPKRIRASYVFSGLLAFGVLVTVSGFMVASVPVTLQGSALAAVGLVGLVLARGIRLPRPFPWALPAGAFVLVATAAESARVGLSAWAPLGLLCGAALLSVPLRALPSPKKQDEPSAAVVIVVMAVAGMVGYEVLRHFLTPSGGGLPSYLAAVGMPVAAAIGAGALAVLAATRGGVAGVAAAGALLLAAAGLSMSRLAGDAWLARQRPRGNVAAPMLLQVVDGEQGTVINGATGFLVLGLALTVVGWWWAAVRRTAG